MAYVRKSTAAERVKLRAGVLAELEQRGAASSRFLAETLGTTRSMVTSQIRQLLAEGLIHEAGAVKKFSSRHLVYVWGPAEGSTIDWRAIAVAQLLLVGPQALQAPPPTEDAGPPLLIPDVAHATTFVGGVNPWKEVKMK